MWLCMTTKILRSIFFGQFQEKVVQCVEICAQGISDVSLLHGINWNTYVKCFQKYFIPMRFRHRLVTYISNGKVNMFCIWLNYLQSIGIFQDWWILLWIWAVNFILPKASLYNCVFRCFWFWFVRFYLFA